MSTSRARVRRVPKRGIYDRAVIASILDDALVSHLAFVDGSQPVAIPTLHARIGDRIYLHGSSASRALRRATSGLPVCITATLIDGLVLSRSAFDHSVNYRSAMVFGTAVVVSNAIDKRLALEAFTEKLIPGRWKDVRPPSPQELKATKVLSVPLDEASAKVRAGPPQDDPSDHGRATWAGVVPLAIERGAPVPDPLLSDGIPMPPYLRAEKI